MLLPHRSRDDREARSAERAKREAGQATLEAALTLPIVLIALLLIVQVGLVVRDVLALHQAAREGVRVAAVSASDDDVVQAVRRSAGPLDADAIDIDIDPDGSSRVIGVPVDVVLGYTERLTIPIVSRFLSVDLPLRASATMRSERGSP